MFRRVSTVVVVVVFPIRLRLSVIASFSVIAAAQLNGSMYGLSCTSEEDIVDKVKMYTLQIIRS